MPKIDVSSVPLRKGSSYPAPFAAMAGGRIKQALGNAGGLSEFGVNLTRLPPGGWSSQRHWHSHEDEFVYLLEGELVLIEDGGETLLKAGDCAAFPKNSGNGHNFVNRSDRLAVYLEVGSRAGEDQCSYPDIDMHLDARVGAFAHKDGTLYSKP